MRQPQPVQHRYWIHPYQQKDEKEWPIPPLHQEATKVAQKDQGQPRNTPPTMSR
jgi:hypothetical protein